jgi:hypothetical protein
MMRPRGSVNLNDPKKGPRRSRLWFVLLPLALLVTLGCGPGGPSRAELANEPAFAATMPGASEQDWGGADSNTGLNAHTSHAWRILATSADQHDVVAWYSATYEAAGWTPIFWPYITMRSGRFPQNAWRRGDLVLGLGFEGSGGGHEITITYQPERENDNPPYGG